MVRKQCAVGFFASLSDAEYGVTGLRSVGFPLNQVMLVANHFRRQDQFAGVDLHNCLETVRLEISAEQADFCQARLSCDRYMIIVHGTEDELDRAASILSHHKLQEWRVYSPTATSR